MSDGSGLVPGLIIANRFRLEKLLGRGGMGSVWQAQHLTLHVPVAVKFIDKELANQGDMLARFQTEANAAAQLKSPHVVQILDYGVDEQGHPYIAMELLEGESLQTRLDREGTLSLKDTVKLVVDVSKALSRAHGAKIVHRDLKPDNIFLCPDDDGFLAKVLDFGVAKSETPVGNNKEKTRTGALLGTPLYMSPEQALGRPGIDNRSDLYSLAVVAYRALTGQVPHLKEGLGELIVSIANDAPPPPSRYVQTPTSVDQWFMQALAKRPEDRFASAREMATSFKVAVNMTVSGVILNPPGRQSADFSGGFTPIASSGVPTAAASQATVKADSLPSPLSPSSNGAGASQRFEDSRRATDSAPTAPNKTLTSPHEVTISPSSQDRQPERKNPRWVVPLVVGFPIVVIALWAGAKNVLSGRLVDASTAGTTPATLSAAIPTSTANDVVTQAIPPASVPSTPVSTTAPVVTSATPNTPPTQKPAPRPNPQPKTTPKSTSGGQIY